MDSKDLFALKSYNLSYMEVSVETQDWDFKQKQMEKQCSLPTIACSATFTIHSSPHCLGLGPPTGKLPPHIK